MVGRERRWIVLGDDGRHVTLGRYTDPSEADFARAGSALQALGIGGWIAVLEGGYYTRNSGSLMMVREIGLPRQTWDAAVDTFNTIRRQALAKPST